MLPTHSSQTSSARVSSLIAGVLGASSRRLWIGPLAEADTAPVRLIGDELQAVGDTLALTMRTHLLLPDGLGLRFPESESNLRGGGRREAVADGARDVDPRTARHGGPHAKPSKAHHLRMRGRGPSFAPGCTSTPGYGQRVGGVGEREEFVIRLIPARQAVFRFQPNQRRIMAGLLMGVTQVIARQEKVSLAVPVPPCWRFKSFSLG